MNRLRAWLTRLAGLLPNDHRERDLADEIESHLALHIDDNLRSGMSPEQARRHALLKLGGVEPTKEAWRDRSTIPLLDHLFHDFRFAFRQLRKNPSFSLTAILILALGIAASVAIFAFVDASLIKPLPYRDPARLVGVFERIPLCNLCPLSYADFVDWKRLNKSFQDMDAFEGTGLMLRTREGSEHAPGATVTAGFFRTLGVTPLLGRDFADGEDQPSAPQTALLSYAAWQKRFAGGRDALGRTVNLNDQPTTIIGVLPPDFHFAAVGPAEFWVPLHPTGECYTRRSCHSLSAVARLRDDASPETARADVVLIAQQLEQQYPDSNRGQGANIVGVPRLMIGNVRLILIVLLSGAGLLLLIAAVNVSSLLLVRAENRRREFAVRSGLGASAARLVAQFITEGLVLVAAGSALGIAFAQWVIALLMKLLPQDVAARMPYLDGLSLNSRVLAFAALISLAAALLFSVVPALRLLRGDLRNGLTEGARGTAGLTWRRLGANLVVIELAMAVVLLVGAGLLGKSLYRLLQVNLGFEPDHVVTLRVSAPQTAYGNSEQKIALARLLESRLNSLPGVQSTSLAVTLPLRGGNTTWIRIVGQPFHGEHNEVSYREVSSSYFHTLRARLIRGRYFTEADDAGKAPVAIVDQALARRYFPGQDPVGKQLINSPDQPPIQVVGLVEDIKEGSLDSTSWPALYIPFPQDPSNHFALVVRTSGDERTVLRSLATAIREIDPGIAVSDERTMMDRINQSPAAYLRRTSAWLAGGFAALALLLSVVGLYGVIAYSVSRRTREIGVRIALGAERRTVYRLIFKEASRLIAAGIVIGLACAAGAATLMRGLLFEVHTWDAPTLAVVAAVLGLAAFAASWLPARRAASVNPVEALRAE